MTFIDEMRDLTAKSEEEVRLRVISKAQEDWKRGLRNEITQTAGAGSYTLMVKPPIGANSKELTWYFNTIEDLACKEGFGTAMNLTGMEISWLPPARGAE